MSAHSEKLDGAHAGEAIEADKQNGTSSGISRTAYIAFSGLCVITLAAAVDATSLGVALPIISNLLHGTALEAFWSGTSFLLTSTVFQPVIGSLSTIYGRKALLLASIAVFTIGIIVAGVAHNFTTILAGRSVQGIGGGGILGLTEIIITDLAPLRERGKLFGILASMWAIGTVSGPIIGAGFAQNVTWRWLFWILLPLCGISFVIIPLSLRLELRRSSLMSKMKRFDYFGAFLFISSTTSFLLSITFGGVMFRWDSWRILVPMLLGIAGFTAFCLYEWFCAAEPLIRLRVFWQRTAGATFFGSFAHGLILWCLVYYLALYYQGVKHQSAIHSSISVFPETFTIAPAAVFTGISVTAIGKFRWAVWAGWTLAALGMGLLQFLDVDTSTPVWIIVNLVGGIGLGMLFPALAFGVQAASSNSDQAYAVSMFVFMRSFGQTIGVAAGGVIFQNSLSKKLAKFPDLAGRASATSRDAVALVEYIKALPADNEIRRQLVWAYSEALKSIWWFLTAMAIAALLGSLLTEELSIERPLETDQGIITKEKHSSDEERGSGTSS